MKKSILTLSLLALLCACNNEEAAEKDNKKDLLPTDLVTNPVSANGTDTSVVNSLPTMDFADTMHNFGSIKEGEVATYDFEFRNNGKTPLLISTASGSCGCTVPDYPREPIQPGSKGVIKVKFNSEGRPGHQEKTVTINTNSKKGMHMLYIKAEVASKS
jgi:hypothetical protein